MTNPKLSVIVPCRLAGTPGIEMRAAFLRLCLTALGNQTADNDDFEVLVVDDASEVEIARIVEDMVASGLPIQPQVIRNKAFALGITGAYNLGVEHATGTYLLLSTDDSLLAPDAVQKHLEAQESRSSPAYLCGTEYLYVAGVLFNDLIAGHLHRPDDLSVRMFGKLLGIDDLRTCAEQLGFTNWNVTEDDVRSGYDRVLARSAVTPPFQDLYRELQSDRQDLRWLCVRMGNHSIPAEAYARIGGMTASQPGNNSDQDLGLKLQTAGIGIAGLPTARSVLIEHWRNLRAYSDHSGLTRLAERWPQPAVQQLASYFSGGFERTLAEYRIRLAKAATTQR